MGTHPIFESDFDCLTECIRLKQKKRKEMLFQWTLLAMTNAVRYKDCGTEGITLESVDVTPCPIEPCELHKGSNYSIAVHFDENIEDELSLSLCGYIGPVCVPFPTDTPKQKNCPRRKHLQINNANRA